MKKLLFLITMMVCALCASAQTYLDHLQKKQAGQGIVVIVQSADITALVNNTAQPKQGTSAVKPEKSQKRKENQSSVRSQVTDTDESETEATETDTSRKLMRNAHKINGYRVQVFAGGNSRNDRTKAQDIGHQIKQHFPSQPVYVHFQSPRWICRMGNYRTQEEARAFLTQVQALGFSHASIVKGKITVSD